MSDEGLWRGVPSQAFGEPASKRWFLLVMLVSVSKFQRISITPFEMDFRITGFIS